MKTILTIALIFVASISMAQTKNTSKKDATITLKPGAGISITHVADLMLYNDTGTYDYTPLMIHAKMIAIDTTYSLSNNVAFQAVRSVFTIGKQDWQLIVKRYYDGKIWIFRSCEVMPRDHGFIISTSTYPYNFQLAPYIQH